MNDGTTLTYRAAHYAITKRRGSASQYPCVDCGRPAHHWCYDHSDPDEIVTAQGRVFSSDTNRYDPRCGSCHRLFDVAYRRRGVPQLHEMAFKLEPEIREAILQRKEARKRWDLDAVDHWDSELERLTEPLTATAYPALLRFIDEAS